MNPSQASFLKSFLKYSISFGIGVGLVFWAFQGVDFADILERFRTVDYGWILLSISIGIFSHYLRAIRWNLLLNPLGYKTSLRSAFPIVLSMYLVNFVLPRAGEIYRCGALKKTDNVPVSTSFGTVIAERFFDMILLVAFLLIMFLFEWDKFQFLFEEIVTKDLPKPNLWLIGISIVALSVVGVTLYRFINRSENSLIVKFREFLREILSGLTSYRKSPEKIKFWLLTMGIWVAYYYMSYVVIFSVEETANLTFSVGFMLLALGGIAIAAPVQGGIGAYHILVSQGLALYGLSKESGLFFATLLHGSQMVGIILFGSISFLFLLVRETKKKVSADS